MRCRRTYVLNNTLPFYHHIFFTPCLNSYCARLYQRFSLPNVIIKHNILNKKKSLFSNITYDNQRRFSSFQKFQSWNNFIVFRDWLNKKIIKIDFIQKRLIVINAIIDNLYVNNNTLINGIVKNAIIIKDIFENLKKFHGFYDDVFHNVVFIDYVFHMGVS